jgi:IS605 OrfB family transposase
MKLVLQMKLLPDPGQEASLLDTLRACNTACNAISKVAWEAKTFNQFKLHHLVYRRIKDSSRLSAQALIRCISKVADAYKLDKKTKRGFKPLGAITYDERILSYKDDSVSIWSVDGRLHMPFLCHNRKYLPYVKGEADLIYRKGKFFLFQTVEVPEEAIKDVEEFIGVDFGVNNIATLSDGTQYGSEQLDGIRNKYFKTRHSLQSKGTSGSKKCLKRLKGREARFAAITNHTISKRIVGKAVTLGMGVAVEDLKGIRERTTVRKKQRRRHNSWSFFQLRAFLEYKARLSGVPFVAVNPRYTSQVCNACKVIGIRRGSSFVCPSCGNVADADVNAARNIAQLGIASNRSRRGECVCFRSLHVPSMPRQLAAG